MYNEILSTALGNGERLSRLLSYPSDIFPDWQYVLIMDQLKELAKTETSIDIAVLTARLNATDNYKKVSQIIGDIMLAPPTVNFDYILNEAAQAARRRDVLMVQEELKRGQITIEESRARYDEIDSIYVIDSDIYCSISDLAGMDFDEIYPENNFIPWKLKSMNRHCLGIFANNFIVIAGQPGIGKTTFVNEEARQGKVLYIQMEMTRPEIFAKYLQTETGIPVKKIIANTGLSDVDKASLKKAMVTIKDSGIDIKLYDRRNDDFNFIITTLKTELMTNNYDKVIIDNLQRIRNIGEGEAGVANLTGTLKQFAKDFNTPILALSHMIKRSYSGQEKPHLGDVKGEVQ